MAASRSALRLLSLCAPVLLLTGGLLACVQAARAEELAFGDTVVRTVSLAEFHVELQRLQALVAACAANGKDCDGSQPHEDERVGEGASGAFATAFEVHWGWLRTALHLSQSAPAEDRARYMREAQAQLEAMARETGPPQHSPDQAQPHPEQVQPAGKPAQPDPAFVRARSAANEVLRTPEFAGDSGPTWLDRKIAWLESLIARLFSGVSALGSAAPWLGTVLEWLLFVSAAVGLVVFLLRTLARQRMRLALGEAAPAATAWDREATGWAQLAEAHAAAAEWREAVHCLYWAAIVLLESRRAWRHNPTRTPREYVRLLKAGSARQQGLRGLTQILERVWYGQRAATVEDYRSAQSCFAQLESAVESSGAGAAANTAAGPAGATA
jgi:hypothetical protein